MKETPLQLVQTTVGSPFPLYYTTHWRQTDHTTGIYLSPTCFQTGSMWIHHHPLKSDNKISDNDSATSSIACVAGASFFGARGVILRTCPCVFPPAHCIKTDQNKFCSVRPGRLPAQWCNHLSYKQLAFANSVCQFFYSGGWSDQGSHPCIWHKFAKNFFTSH